jgi:hypothetical protein
MNREKKGSRKEAGRRRFVRIGRDALIIAAVTLALCRIVFWAWAERSVLTYRYAKGELTLQDGLAWPKPWYCAMGHRVRDPVNNFVKIHDGRGFTPVTRPVDLLESETSGFEEEATRKLIADFLVRPSLRERSETARRTKKVKLTVGDSNIHVDPSIPLKSLNRDVYWMDSIGLADEGPDFYHVAVERWLMPGGTVDRLLRENRALSLEVDLVISSQNDLENLSREGKEDPAESRLVFPRPAGGEGGQSARAGGVSFRSRFAPLLKKLFTQKEIAFLKETLKNAGANRILSDERMFAPSDRSRETRRLLRHLDCIAKIMERYGAPGRSIELNITVFPSVYDNKATAAKYGWKWDTILEKFARGDYLPDGHGYRISVTNSNVRDRMKRWYGDDRQFSRIFHHQDLHYIFTAQIDLFLAWALERGEVPREWLDRRGDLRPEKRAWLHQILLKEQEERISRFSRALDR